MFVDTNDEEHQSDIVPAEIGSFIESGFMPLESEHLEHLWAPTNSQPNYMIIRRSWTNNIERIFFTLFPMDFWDLLVSIINDTITEKLSRNEIAKTSLKYFKYIDLSTLIRWYGITLCLENLYSKMDNNIASNFAKLKKQMPADISMGYHRYCAILSCIIPNQQAMQDLCKILRCAWQSAWSPGGNGLVIDEHSISYQVSKEVREKLSQSDPVPKHYIPRKKHPNCLVVYQLATKSTRTGEPYIIDIEPSLTVPLVAPREVTRRFLRRWSYPIKPHLIFDAAFSGMGPMNEIDDWGGYATFSMSANDMSWIWELLKRKTSLHNWNAAINQKGYIASLYVDVDREKNTVKYHRVLTNGYKGNKVNIDDTNTELIYSREDLETTQMKTRELKNILRENHQRIGGKKKELIERILKTCNHSSTYVDKLQRAIEQNNFHSPAPIHDFYREYFNAVDLHTRRWYIAYYTYGVRQWRTKMFLSICTSGIVNAYTVMKELRNISFKEFRQSLATVLLKFNH